MKYQPIKITAGAVLALAMLTWGAIAEGRSGDPAVNAALQYVQTHRQQLGLTGADTAEMAVSSISTSKQTGVTHVYLQQQYRGVAVWNGMMTVSVHADGSVLSANSHFYAGIAAAAHGQGVKKTAIEAALAAARRLNLKPSGTIHELERQPGAARATKLAHGGIADRAIEAQLVWFPMESKVRLAWSIEIEEVGGTHVWNSLVDAETGEPLAQFDLVDHDSAEATAAAVSRPLAAPMAPLPAFPATDGATYRVFPLPLESPSDGGRSLVSNAANPAASPFGWQDTDGASGAEYTVTRGNNVHAYADRDNNNTPDPGSDPDGGASLVFDFPLDLGARPLDSQPAMVTNLFYWNNIMHDVTYGYGFDEAAGNFQQTNYTGAVGGADYVRAEAQDGSGRNNANFSTPRQNAAEPRPRMQMFEWRSSAPNPITINSGSLSGVFYGPMGGFGESLVTTGPITGDIAYVGRGCDPAYQSGQPLDAYLDNPAGKIAMIDRGSCTFTAKVKKAQDLGALAVIMVNNIAGPPISMGGADPTISIVSVMISLDDGNSFKANLPLNVTIADGTGGEPDRDSDIDAGVISHEYGHGISNRLTGGPNVVTCLQNAEQMGEGWSDFFALVLTTSPSDTKTTARGVGTYVSFQPPDGLGIRPTPYSTDMTVDPATYASVADVVNISQPHGIGYVWNSMLWEVYWNLVDRYGYNANVYGSWNTGGNNRTIQLVMDGMKYQVCSPGFVDGRNAILQADTVLTGGTNKCEIWRGFAKRGLGASASQGSSNNRSDGIQAFDLPAACTAASFAGFRPPINPAPSTNAWAAGDVVPVKFELTGDTSTLQIDSQPVNCTTLEPTGEAPTAVQFAGGTGLKQKAKEFSFNWQTSAGWANSCRRLTLRIPAASDAYAYFNFQ